MYQITAMRSNTTFKLFIILIVALLFRLYCIDKPEGLWNDEYVSWYIASKSSFSDFLYRMLQNCHMPFYYFYLKFWIFFFSDTDLSLRLSSVVPSIISIIVMFYNGKELKNNNTGLTAAFLTAISSFCIYFAQEVRLYSLLFLFTSLTVLFFIRIIKYQSKIDFILYFSANAMVCATHTLGIVFSFFNIICLFIYLYKNNNECKDKIKIIISALKYISPFILVLLILLPFLFEIAFSKSLSQFWSNFSYSKILFTFVDYFSPIQTNIVNSPDTFSTYIYSDTQLNYVFILFALIPLIIGCITVVKSLLSENKIINYLFLSSFLFFITISLISLSGKIILITKYTSEIYPVLILILSYGLLEYKNKFIKYGFISLFISINLIYLIISPDAAPRRTRPEGHLAVVQLLNNSRLKYSDNVLLTYYDVDKFERYLPSKNKYRFYSINKFNFNYFMFNNEDYVQTIKQGKNLYKSYFAQFPNPVIMKYSNDYFIRNMKKGEKIGIIFLNTVSFLSNDNIQDILKDEKRYKDTPFIFLVFSTLRNNLLLSFKDDYKIDSITGSGDWTLFVFEKTH